MEPVLPRGRLGEFNEVNVWGGINGFALQNNQSVDSVSETNGERKAMLAFLLPGGVLGRLDWPGFRLLRALAHGPLRMGLVLVILEFRSSLSRYKGLEPSARDAGVHFLYTSFCSPCDLGMETAR